MEIKIAVSRCLLGDAVRYDAKSKPDAFVCTVLARQVQLVPLCPEVECGLTVPREPIHLVKNFQEVRLLTRQTNVDITGRMESYIASKLDELAKLNLHGAIFKSYSPSCGLSNVPIANHDRQLTGRGLFAAAFIERFPLVAVTEERLLTERYHKQAFLNKIFTIRQWRETLRHNHSTAGLKDFHAAGELLFLSHSAAKFTELSNLAVRGCFSEYAEVMAATLSILPSAKKHCAVMMKLISVLHNDLTQFEHKILQENINAYAAGTLSGMVPLALLHHYLHKYQHTEWLNQSYWNILQPVYQ